MKKTLATFGATALGFALVGAGAAAPAAAADATEPCADFTEQLAATGEVRDNWYQDCVPQYGLGKAEFSIVADVNDPAAEFPEGFVSLDELPEEAVSTTGDLATQQAYFDGAPVGTPLGAPITPVVLVSAGPTTQHYYASVVAPVTSIGSVDLGSVPAAVGNQCAVGEATYAGGWVATFGSVDTTYSQTVDGAPWNYTITASPLPTYFFGTFGEEAEPWCVTDGVLVMTGESSLLSQNDVFGLVLNNLIDFDNEVLVDLGTFGRTLPAAPIAAAQLPNMGADVVPLAVAAGSFTALGLALLGFVTLAGRRRSRA